MILILEKNTTHPQAQQLIERLENMGLKAVKEEKGGRIAIAIVSGIDAGTQEQHFSRLPHVEKVEQFSQQFKLAGKDLRDKKLIIDVKGKTIGGGELCVMAGPCSIENEEQIHRIAKSVKQSGAQFLRGGAFKPRTSPYDFQGLGEEGVRYLQEAARENDMVSVSEVMDLDQLEIALGKVDVFQVGARNMQNYTLLKELGKTQTPVMLKRGFAATYREFLNAAEYILNAGNPNVILCERGIRTFESYTRNTLDIGAVPALRELTHLPIIIDPSHGTGIRSMVAPMAYAGVAAGADGIMVEVHYDPDRSYSDAQQAISCEAFAEMMPKLE
ncbi:MAG: 3-deoxy-7-phosphoheptulonate synthase, partial [Coxiellaceae bacterium]|nr:3-deoxy-7-phosphoheptulonate synthase [Coxiellaceae bacterium]